VDGTQVRLWSARSVQSELRPALHGLPVTLTTGRRFGASYCPGRTRRNRIAPLSTAMYELSESYCEFRVLSIRSGALVEWFDDLILGMRFKSPEKRVTREEIRRFASEYDPQPYHLDEEAAERSIFGGLAASGWHTAAMAMRLIVDTRPFGPHPLLGVGVDELRWLAPVRPDDVIHLEGEVVELIPSRSKPQGIVRVKWTAYNQRGEPVYSVTPIAIVPRRHV
jgi:acyl dehydratase